MANFDRNKKKIEKVGVRNFFYLPGKYETIVY